MQDCGAPGSAQDPSAAASRRDRMEDRDDNVLPLSGPRESRKKVVFGQTSLKSNPSQGLRP